MELSFIRMSPSEQLEHDSESTGVNKPTFKIAASL